MTLLNIAAAGAVDREFVHIEEALFFSFVVVFCSLALSLSLSFSSFFSLFPLDFSTQIFHPRFFNLDFLSQNFHPRILNLDCPT